MASCFLWHPPLCACKFISFPVRDLQAEPGVTHRHCALQAPPDKRQLRGQAPAAVQWRGAAHSRLGCHARACVGHGCCCEGAESIVNTMGALVNSGRGFCCKQWGRT